MDDREVLVITGICLAVVILIAVMKLMGENYPQPGTVGMSNPAFPLASSCAAKTIPKRNFI